MNAYGIIYIAYSNLFLESCKRETINVSLAHMYNDASVVEYEMSNSIYIKRQEYDELNRDQLLYIWQRSELFQRPRHVHLMFRRIHPFYYKITDKFDKVGVKCLLLSLK